MARKGKLKKKRGEKEIKRPVRFRRYNYLFLIVCEDEKTEPNYFKQYKQEIPEETLYLKPVGTGKDPKGVVAQTILEKEKLENEAKKEVDEVWVVFDKDDADENSTKIQRFQDAFSIAETHEFKVAYSNEVFELWFLLHFIDLEATIPLSRQEIYTLLKEEFQKIKGYEDYEYEHDVIDVKTIEVVFKGGNRDKAIQRAESLFASHSTTPPIQANPSTKVHLLVKELLSWIDYYAYDPKNEKG